MPASDVMSSDPKPSPVPTKEEALFAAELSDEYRNIVEKEKALKRRFPPSVTELILKYPWLEIAYSYFNSCYEAYPESVSLSFLRRKKGNLYFTPSFCLI